MATRRIEHTLLVITLGLLLLGKTATADTVYVGGDNILSNGTRVLTTPTPAEGATVGFEIPCFLCRAQIHGGSLTALAVIPPILNTINNIANTSLSQFSHNVQFVDPSGTI